MRPKYRLRLQGHSVASTPELSYIIYTGRGQHRRPTNGDWSELKGSMKHTALKGITRLLKPEYS